MTCNTIILKSLFLTLVHHCTYITVFVAVFSKLNHFLHYDYVKVEPHKVSMYCTYMWQNYIINTTKNMDVATYLRLNKEQTIIFYKSNIFFISEII